MSAASDQEVVVERKGHALWITINRPEARNALDWDAWVALENAWNQLIDDPELWVGVITATGERAFSAGADLKRLPAQIAKLRAEGHPDPTPPVGFNKRFCDKPVVAAINGDALGGGLEVALAADIRIAASHARLGLPEARWGAIPGAGGTQRLPRTVSLSTALEVLFTARVLTADEALQFGLVNRVVPGAELQAQTEEMVESILAMAPVAVRAIKRAVLKGIEGTIEEGLAVEKRELDTVMSSEDYTNNITAFASGKAPIWAGR